MTLTPSQIDFYWTNGYLALPDLFPPAHIQALRRRIEELCENWQGEDAQKMHVLQEPEAVARGVASPTTIRKFAGMAEVDPLFWATASYPALLDSVEQLIGRPLSLHGDQAFLKPPFHGSEKPEHQDNAYFQVKPADHVITCWIALDDADEENGCMYYYAGSHRGGLLAHTEIPDTPHLVPEGLDRADSTPVPIRAGGCILHHAQTVHWTPANRSPRWRRNVTLHIARSDAKLPLFADKEPPKKLRDDA